ncbi:nucleotidyltransferase domain-containing protein [Chitinophaga sp. HK235]|uniref:nucleotidyltransferase domain-containing protein n=1 Tax=Chitinophaga sp. HK235 TaxID=2952571 RepID=UPI001BAB18DD|nr:nucleotidyltransferase domain-containing protein [Chitinophaga sp. HK235]
MLTPEDINGVVQSLVAKLDPERIIVFGSYAKQMATPRSDLDIFVIQRTALPMPLRTVNIQPMLRNHLPRVDVHIYTPEETDQYATEDHSFVQTVLKTGYTAYERASFLH